MLNKVMLIGNLGGDPEVRHLENGVAVARFSVATNERYKDKAGVTQTITEWHDVIAWRGLAQVAEKFLKKGSMVYVEGKITTRKWQDKEGQTRRTTEVVANNFQILDRKENAPGSNFGTTENEPKNLAGSSQSPMQEPVKPDAKPIGKVDAEDDLPF